MPRKRRYDRIGAVPAPYAIAAAAVLAISALLLPGVRPSSFNNAWAVLNDGNADGIAAYLDSFGAWAPLISIALMVAQGVIAPIPGMLVMIANGAAFGIWLGGLVTLTGQVLAAALCFGLSRMFGLRCVERVVGANAIATADRQFRRWGTPGIVLARVVPGISFDAVSYLAGLSSISFRRFIVLTAIGAVPQAYLYAWLVQSHPAAAWTVAGIMTAMIIVLTGVSWMRRRSPVRQPGRGFVPAPSIVSETV